jgi:trimethylamine--corrinoid protein Co-methyltransferase
VSVTPERAGSGPEAPPEARRGRGRHGRRARREAAAGRGAPAYITRRIPCLDVLDEESLVRLEEAADRILEEIGIAFRGGDAQTIELWRGAGAEVEGERVRFPRGLVREVLRTAPARFVQHARNPDRSLQIGGDAVVFAPAYGSPFVMDLDHGRRYGTIEDFRNFVKLAYALPWLHHSGGTVCEPTDVPVNKRHLHMVHAHLRYSDKALLGSVTAPQRAEDSVAMARLVFGDDFVDRHCVIMGNVNVNSPLVWDATMTGAIRAYARANQGSVIVPFILGGAMGPVTTAGAIAQAHAETLVGCALSQLERPGAPTVYGNFLSSMSLRSGSPTFGTPEPALGSLAVGQLARRAGLPLRCSGAFTTSKLPDAQAMTENLHERRGAVRGELRAARGRLPRRAAVDVLREADPGRGSLRRAARLPGRFPRGRRHPRGGRDPGGGAGQPLPRLRPHHVPLRERLLALHHRRQRHLGDLERARRRERHGPGQPAVEAAAGRLRATAPGPGHRRGPGRVRYAPGGVDARRLVLSAGRC